MTGHIFRKIYAFNDGRINDRRINASGTDCPATNSHKRREGPTADASPS